MCASSFVFARTGFIGMCSGLARPRPSPRCRPTNRHVGCCDVTKDIAIFGDRSDLPSYIALLQTMAKLSCFSTKHTTNIIEVECHLFRSFGG